MFVVTKSAFLFPLRLLQCGSHRVKQFLCVCKVVDLVEACAGQTPEVMAQVFVYLQKYKRICSEVAEIEMHFFNLFLFFWGGRPLLDTRAKCRVRGKKRIVSPSLARSLSCTHTPC